MAEEQKFVTKTLSLRILRPFYPAEVETRILEEKNKKLEKGKKKYPGKLETELKVLTQLDKYDYQRIMADFPEIISWDMLSQMLTQLQRQVARVYNESISLLYVETIAKGQTKGMDHFLSSVVYPKAYTVFKNAAIALGIRQKIQSNFKPKELFLQRSALPTAKSDNFPIQVYKQKGKLNEDGTRTDGGFTITTSGNDFVIEIPLSHFEYDQSNKNEPFNWIKKNGKMYSLKLILSTFRRQKNKGFKTDEGTDAEIRKVMNGEYQVSWIEINRGKRVGEHQKWFVNFTIQQPIYGRKIDSNIMGGIDIGVKSPLVCAVNNSFARFSVDSNDVMKFSKQTFAFRRRLLSKNSLKRKGHGAKNKLEPITKMTEKNDRFRKKILERWSKEVANFFIKNQVGIVQMEDLSSMKDRPDNFFNQYLRGFWPYAQMQNMIENKLREYGIEVTKVKAKYTSQLCSGCHEWNSQFNFDYRKENKFPKFKCTKCDLEISADYNAARNIATKDIEKIIARYTKGKTEDHDESVI